MVNTVMTPSDMAHVLILDVAVIINAQEINNRYVEENGLSPSTQSVSTLTVYGEHKSGLSSDADWQNSSVFSVF